MKDIIGKTSSEEEYEDSRKKTEEEFLLKVGELSQEINKGLDNLKQEKSVTK